MNECLPDDVQSKIITAQVDNIAPRADYYLPYYHGGTGELVHKIPTPNYLRLRRKEFARVLGYGLDIRVNLPRSYPVVYPSRPLEAVSSVLLIIPEAS